MNNGFFAQNRINKLFDLLANSVFDLPTYAKELEQLILEKMLANKVLSTRELDYVGVEEIVLEDNLHTAPQAA